MHLTWTAETPYTLGRASLEDDPEDAMVQKGVAGPTRPRKCFNNQLQWLPEYIRVQFKWLSFNLSRPHGLGLGYLRDLKDHLLPDETTCAVHSPGFCFTDGSAIGEDTGQSFLSGSTRDCANHFFLKKILLSL